MYKTINGYTKAKMIEMIKKYNNGTKATNKEGDCQYLTENGNRCAVGCFLLEEIARKYTTYSVYYVSAKSPKVRTLLPLRMNGLSGLQKTHDSYDETSNFTLHETLINWIENNVED